MIAALAVAVAPAAIFAPPLDTPILYRVEEVREQGGTTLRFAIDRRVTFHRDTDGLRAVVETIAVTGDAGRPGRIFEAMHRAMIGRRVTFRLSATGTVDTVDDSAAVWDAQMAGVEAALATRDAARAAQVATMLAPLRGLTPDQRAARIADMLAPLIAGPPPALSPTHEVRLATTPASSGTLAGTEQVSRTPEGDIAVERDVRGTVAGLPTTVSLRRRQDARTGLIVESVERRTSDTPAGPFAVVRSTRRL